MNMGDCMADAVFESMDEVKSFAAEMKSQLDEAGYHALLFLLGLLKNQGVSKVVEIDGDPVEIDCSIASFVAKCNGRGIKTLACCSGLEEEHENAEYKPEKGYISFVFDAKIYKLYQNGENSIKMGGFCLGNSAIPSKLMRSLSKWGASGCGKSAT